MKKIRTPDGIIHQFPDDATDAEISQALNGPSVQSAGFQQPQPPHTPTPPDYQSPLFPAAINRSSGNIYFDPNAGLLGQAIGAVTMPGDVITGKQPVFGMEAQTGKLTYAPEVQPSVIAPATRMGNLTAMFTPVNPAVRAGDLAIPGEKTAIDKAVPTAEKLAQLGNQQIAEARQMPVNYSPEILKEWSLNHEQVLNERGLSDVSAPDVVKVLRRFQDAPEGTVGVSANNIIAFRQELQNIAHDAVKGIPTGAKNARSEYVAAAATIDALDQFLRTPLGEGDVSGPAAEFAQAYATGNANRAAAFRASDVSTKQNIAMLRNEAANSGNNLGNTLRQRITDILVKNEQTKGKYLRGWTTEELTALKAINEGTFSENAWRAVAKKLASGGGWGQSTLSAAAAGAGYIASGGTLPGVLIGGAVPPIAGAASRTIYDSMVKTSIDRLEKLLLQRSPEFARTVAPEAANPTALIAALRTALMLPKTEKPPTAGDLYLSAKKQREDLDAANAKMSQPGIY